MKRPSQAWADEPQCCHPEGQECKEFQIFTPCGGPPFCLRIQATPSFINMDALEAEIREITKTLAQIDIDLGKKLPRDEVKYLRRKEEQLRRKEEQLRDEQLILLKAGEEWHLAWQA